MRKLLSGLLLFGILAGASACRKAERGEGTIVSQTKNIGAFEELILETSCDVEVYKTTDSLSRVEISDYANIIQYILTTVEGNKLYIRQPSNKIIRNSEAKAIIYTNRPLKILRNNGSGYIVLNNNFNELEVVNITGSGKIEGKMSTTFNLISATISGSGKITFFGEAFKAILNIQGSGAIDFKNVNAQQADCSISGSGDIQVNASQSLHVNISGSGNVDYWGYPNLTQSISGSGSVTRH
jgi:hypothetical protein